MRNLNSYFKNFENKLLSLINAPLQQAPRQKYEKFEESHGRSLDHLRYSIMVTRKFAYFEEWQQP